tara:strand:- start:21661 stop:21876 length:216 start_codon:yes stop_codon:yes gene_type:complete
MGRTKKLYTFADINTALKRSKDLKENEPSIESLYEASDSKDVQIAELNHQIIGYKAVISYLEHQLGLGKSQ